MNEARKEIFYKLRGWIKKVVSLDVVLAEQKAALPNSAVVVVDSLQVYGNVGSMNKTEPKRTETGLSIDKISEHRIEALVYFMDSLDGKQDSSGEFLKLLANLQDNVFDRFEKSETESISVLNAQQVSLNSTVNGAEYRRVYAMRLVLLLAVREKPSAIPIESVDLKGTLYKPNGETV